MILISDGTVYFEANFGPILCLSHAFWKKMGVFHPLKMVSKLFKNTQPKLFNVDMI